MLQRAAPRQRHRPEPTRTTRPRQDHRPQPDDAPAAHGAEQPCRRTRLAALPTAAWLQIDTVTVADETCCCAHSSSTTAHDHGDGEQEYEAQGAAARQLSRFHRMTGRQSSAARRKRAAAPRKGGTYSVRVSAATRCPQTTPSATKASQFSSLAAARSHVC